MPKVGIKINVYKLSVLTIATKLEDAHISYYLLVSLLFVAEINPYSFLNQARTRHTPGFLKLLFSAMSVYVCACVCVCVCVSVPEAINYFL